MLRQSFPIIQHTNSSSFNFLAKISAFGLSSGPVTVAVPYLHLVTVLLLFSSFILLDLNCVHNFLLLLSYVNRFENFFLARTSLRSFHFNWTSNFLLSLVVWGRSFYRTFSYANKEQAAKILLLLFRLHTG